MAKKLSYEELRKRGRRWREGLAGGYKKPGAYIDEFKNEVFFPEELQRRPKRSRQDCLPVRQHYAGSSRSLMQIVAAAGIEGDWRLHEGMVRFYGEEGIVLCWQPKTRELWFDGDAATAHRISEHLGVEVDSVK